MDWEDVANMSNRDAAAILRNHLKNMTGARANGKTMLFSAYIHAMIKAILALESTPDEEESNEQL